MTVSHNTDIFFGLTRETVFDRDREARVKLYAHIDLNRAQRILFEVTGDLTPVADWIHSIVKDGEKNVRDTRMHPVPGHQDFQISMSAERGALFCWVYHDDEFEFVSSFAVAPKTRHIGRVLDEVMLQPGTMAASMRMDLRAPLVAYSRSSFEAPQNWLSDFERAIAAAWCVTGRGMIFSESVSETHSESEP